MRSFSLGWLDEFGPDGLVYSIKQDAAYCKYCRLFPGGERGLLVEKPFCKWKDAICEFSAYFRAMQIDKTKGVCENKLHMSAVLRATEFIKCMESDLLPINQVVSTKSQEQIKSNRQVVKSVAQTVHFLVKQNLSLHGHRDDEQYYNREGVNPGNFQELLKFQCESGDSCLKLHLEEGNKNATYHNKTIQNQLIQIMGDQILEGIIAKVQTAKFFAVSADEATDRDFKCSLL